MDLHEACRNGNLERVKLDINAKNNDGYTPLHWASRTGHLNFVKYLVENGVNIDAKNNDGYTPLHYSYGEVKVYLENVIRSIKEKREKENFMIVLTHITGDEILAEVISTDFCITKV